jgi:hypothetical protein
MDHGAAGAIAPGPMMAESLPDPPHTGPAAPRQTMFLAPRDAWSFALAAVARAREQVVAMRMLLMVVAVAMAVFVALLYAWSVARSVPMALLTRDLAATAGLRFDVGIVSNIGAMVWCATASISGFAAWHLRGMPAQRERAGLLGAAALLLFLMGSDDFLMLHETVYPKLGLSEAFVVLLYGVGYGAMLLRWREVVLDSELLLLALGTVLFAGSVIVDGFAKDSTALEDLLKLSGQVLWLLYFVRLAARGWRESSAQAQGGA